MREQEQDASLVAQWARAREEANRLQAKHASGEANARTLYLELLAFLDRDCPGVFLGLTGRSLYDLLRKGSQPVSGEALSQYRHTKAVRVATQGEMPVPTSTQQHLLRLVEGLWADAFIVARREAGDVADARNAHLKEALTQAQREHRQQAEQLTQALADLQQAQGFERRYHELRAQAEQALAARDQEIARHTAMQQSLQDELVAQRERMRELEAQVAEQTETLRSALAQAESAYAGLRQRALQDVEAARQETKEVKRDLQQRQADLSRCQAQLQTTARELTEARSEVHGCQTRLASVLGELNRLKRRGPISSAAGRRLRGRGE